MFRDEVGKDAFREKSVLLGKFAIHLLFSVTLQSRNHCL
jgi:hypothetical protein